jgi:uncharacterized protein YuzE
MARRQAVKTDLNNLIIRAIRRVKIPAVPFRIEYDEDVDTLYLRFRDDIKPNRTKGDIENGVIYDYCGRQLVGIEILDASGQ